MLQLTIKIGLMKKQMEENLNYFTKFILVNGAVLPPWSILLGKIS